MIPTPTNNMPLAARMRPEKLQDILGQEHILAPDKLLYRSIKADRLGSIILYGPPGTGKTSIAHVIANETKCHFVQVNATVDGKKEMETLVKAAQTRQEHGQKTIMFIDEIHRFNKTQQDYLLPFVENGLITLIGATTENPYFEVNKALLSRSRIFELKPLSKDHIRTAILNALQTDDILTNVRFEDDALDFLSNACSGDLRSAFNALELAALTTDPDTNNEIVINLDIAQECIQKKAVIYDKDGDQHYDAICAFIESLRGSNPDGALYYLARMLTAGEDIKYIARRMMIQACYDVGMADPLALVIATNASLACERIGMPESVYILADAAVYIACAPKSDSIAKSYDMAAEIVANTGTLPIPPHIQDCSYKSAVQLGHGAGYVYPHDYPNHFVTQQYLPDEIKNAWIYKPTHIGHELNIANHMNKLLADERQRLLNQTQNGGQTP